MNASTIVQKLWNYCNVLRDDGMSYGDYVEQLAAQAERIKLVGDGVSYVGSGKTITDHALSKLAGADCRVFNVVSREPVCTTTGTDR